MTGAHRRRGFFPDLIGILLAVVILTNIATLPISRLDFIPALNELNVSTAFGNNTDNAERINMPNDTRMEFIHIGKTGGMTIVKSFKFVRKRNEVVNHTALMP